MTRLLIYEPSRLRIADDLAALGDALAILSMHEDGAVTLGGAPADLERTAPDIAWATNDVFTSARVRDFMAALRGAPALAWVQSAAAGFDHPAFRALIERGTRLTTSHGQAVAMADHVLWGVLDHFQRGPERRGAQGAADWRRIPVREVLDSRWLVVGFGAVGQAVGLRARAFGARVVGVRRGQDPSPAADEIVPPAALLDQVPHADVVVLCAPLGPSTRHLANAALFAAMKPDAVLVNVGRGGLVDEAALLAALDAGRPAHAVLDVFETEPLPAASPFWRHPRVSLTAHGSGLGQGQDGRNAALFVDNLGRYLAGRPLLNEIDPKEIAA